MALPEDYTSLRKLHESTNSEVEQLNRKLAAAKGFIAVLEAEKRQWEQEKKSQQVIFQIQLDKVNSEVNNLGTEINRLRAKITELGGESDG